MLDASDRGIGTVLSQTDPDGREHVIAYASRLLSKSERRYCVTRRELLAVVYFTNHFRPYLLGKQFVLRTDHGSLVWLQNFKEPEGQLARWLEKLQQYDFVISHCQGKKHWMQMLCLVFHANNVEDSLTVMRERFKHFRPLTQQMWSNFLLEMEVKIYSKLNWKTTLWELS